MLGKFALAQFKKVNGSISKTERVALESGTSGFEKSIFAGTPDWKGLMATPPPRLTAEEQSFLDNEVEQLCAMVDDWQVRTETRDLSPETWDFMKKNKFFGMIIPKEYGGLGFSAAAHSAVVAKLSSRGSTLSATGMVPNSLGPAELILNYGTEEEKKHYLPRLARGEEIPCFALTSPKAGSDATSIEDEGVIFKGEDDKLYMRLNWDKRYITLAPIATLFGLAFKLKDPDHLLGGEEDIGITLALVPASTPGISRDFRHMPMGGAFMNGPHQGKDVVVPLDNIIGGRKNAGKGWPMLVDCLSVGRAISLPASSAGIAHDASRKAGAYSLIREQFGMPLARMAGIQESLARIGGLTYMIDAARILPLQDLDLAHEAGHEARPAVAGAILKYHTTEAARQIAIDNMDIHAGKGVMEGPDNPAAPLYMGVPTAITVEGANILTRNLMIFGQSAFLAHPYTLKEVNLAQAAVQPGANIKKLEKEAGKLLVKHLANVFNNAVKGFVLGLTNGRLSAAPKSGPDSRYYQQINRLSAGFGFMANATMLTLQSDLKRKQRTSALLADGFSNLYMAAQVLRRWNLDGRRKEDQPLMDWAAQHCLHRAEEALHEAVGNSVDNIQIQLKGIPVIGKMGFVTKLAKLADNLGALRIPLKLVMFPLGRWTSKPSHELDAKVAEILSTPGETRDRLTAGMFIPKDDKEYIARADRAMAMAYKALPQEQALARLAKENSRFFQSGLKNIVGRIPAAIEKAANAKADAHIEAIAQTLHSAEAKGALVPVFLPNENAGGVVEELRKSARAGTVTGAKECSDAARHLLRAAADRTLAQAGGDAAAVHSTLSALQDRIDHGLVTAAMEQRRAAVRAVEHVLKGASKHRQLNRDFIAPVVAALEAAAVASKKPLTTADFAALTEQILRSEVNARTLTQADNHAAMVAEALGKGLINKETADFLNETQKARENIIRTDFFPYERPAHHRAPAAKM